MRPTTRSRRMAMTLTSAVALTATLLAPVATRAASPTPSVASCTVRNLTHPSTESTLQAAIDDADPNDKLEVRGTCTGITTIGKSIRIVGKRTPATGAPTLDAQGVGRALRITAGTVRLTDLRIIRGIAPDPGPTTQGGLILNEGGPLTLTRVTVRTGVAEAGGGIYSLGPLTLVDSIVANNEAAVGGGIHATNRLTIRGTSQVHHNHVNFDGGGILAFGDLTIGGSASVHHNSAGQDGGGLWFGAGVGPAGTVTIRDQARIRDNEATRYGGGIVLDGGTITLRDGAVLAANEAGFGGGVAILRGTLATQGRSEIRRNTAFDAAGVLGNAANGTVRIRMSDRSAIQGNHATTAIGGVRVNGHLTMSEHAAIRQNVDDGGFAGVLVAAYPGIPASLTMRGSSRISGHTLPAGGAGLIKQRTCTGDIPTFTGTQGRVVGNTPRNIRVNEIC